MTLMAVSSGGTPFKVSRPRKDVSRPIPVHAVLGRLDEICKEDGYLAEARLYVATVGVMLEFRGVSRLLTDENMRDLEKLRKLISGTLYVGPCAVDGKSTDGGSFRLVEVTLRTNRPVEVIPISATPS